VAAAEAATVAKRAGVGLLVLTHFSARYLDLAPMLEEARAIFPNTELAEDLKVIPESQKEPLTQPPANPESLSGSQPGAPGAGASVARLARPEGTVPSGAPVLIIVIDDVGYNNGELKPFLELPFPITFAVLPQLPHSADSALSIQKAGKEMILHQPMEALGGNDPGPHAVYLSMDEATIAKTVAENIDSFPYQPKGMLIGKP